MRYLKLVDINLLITIGLIIITIGQLVLPRIKQKEKSSMTQDLVDSKILKNWLLELSALDGKCCYKNKVTEFRAKLLNCLNLFHKNESGLLELFDHKLWINDKNIYELNSEVLKDLQEYVTILLEYQRKESLEIKKVRFGCNINYEKLKQIRNKKYENNNIKSLNSSREKQKNVMNLNLDLANNFRLDLADEMCKQLTFLLLVSVMFSIFNKIAVNTYDQILKFALIGNIFCVSILLIVFFNYSLISHRMRKLDWALVSLMILLFLTLNFSLKTWTQFDVYAVFFLGTLLAFYAVMAISSAEIFYTRYKDLINKKQIIVFAVFILIIQIIFFSYLFGVTASETNIYFLNIGSLGSITNFS